MGAFGVQVFDEDGACDSLARFTNSGSTALTTLFPKCISGAKETEYLEVDDCGEVLSIGVLLIALMDYTYIDALTNVELAKPYRDNVAVFVDMNKEQWNGMSMESKQSMVQDTLTIIQHKLLAGPSVSESYELWKETEYFNDWLQVVDKIKNKLSTSLVNGC